jgi:hypothetical protein
MRAIRIIVLLIAAGAVVTGVMIEDTAENPTNLFMPWVFGVTVLETARRKQGAWLYLGAVPVILGVSAYGVGWTLGPGHVTSAVSMLVYAGLAVAIAASVGAKVGPRGAAARAGVSNRDDE